jgi:hypothetical protein
MTGLQLKKNLELNLPEKISRRKFVGGSLAAGGAAVGGALGLAGCSGGGNTMADLLQGVQEAAPQAQVDYLDVDPSQVADYIDMTEATEPEYLTFTTSFDLPVGSLVYQNSDTQALVLGPGLQGNALIRMGFVNLDGGEYTAVLEQALGHNEDFIIYEARASKTALVWVECNMVHAAWRVFAVPIIGGAVSEQAAAAATLLDEGGSLYEPPSLAAADGKVYWTVMPDPQGSASQEDSLLKCADISVKSSNYEARTIYNSPGRMITIPQVSGNTLTIVPRVAADAIYYQLTALSIADDSVLNAAVLPQSLRVSDAIWLGEGFAFCIENNYDYAKGLALFGTYQQLADEQYIYINKMPTSPPVLLSSKLYVKSTKNIVGLDTAGSRAFIVATPAECVSYGDILAGAGLQNRLVTYTTVTSKLGQERGVCKVRVFDPV